MNDPKHEILDKLKSANNILVTVSSDPSVDQLAACIGMTLLLNKLKKHATAVFSGQVPSTIEFLKPEETIEKNTDSLRDFIIALDKSKADKLRYKVEENVVKIFITPYKTSITQGDLEFSQGDFNVDVVVAIGVHEQKDLDQAITAHGRILHDATVMSINLTTGNDLAAVSWVDPGASSLSELCAELIDGIGKEELDAQIATALLTGIVAETERFSNERTTPETMRLSAELMAAGANQQLVATELQAPVAEAVAPAEQDGDEESAPAAARVTSDGMLEINHPEGEEPRRSDEEDTDNGIPLTPPKPHDDNGGAPDGASQQQPATDADTSAEPTQPEQENEVTTRRITEPPELGGQLTANSKPESYDPSIDPLSKQDDHGPLLTHDKPAVAEAPQAEESAPEVEVIEEPQPAPLELPAPTAMPAQDESAAPEQNGPSDDVVIDAEGNLQLPAPQPTTDNSTANDATVAAAVPADDTPAQTVDEPAQGGPGQTTPLNADAARDAVLDALNSTPPTLETIPPKADVGASGYLNVQDLPEDDTTDAPEPVADTTVPLPVPQQVAEADVPVSQPLPPLNAQFQAPSIPSEPAPGLTPADRPLDMPLPPSTGFAAPAPLGQALPFPGATAAQNATVPPPVPPPMTELPPFSPPQP